MSVARGAQSRVKAARAAGEVRLARAQKSVSAVDAGIRWFERERLQGAALLSGGLAYRFFFWLVAFGLFAASIGGFIAHSDPESLESAAKSAGLGGVAAHSATTALASGKHTQYYFLMAGVGLMAWFGIGAVKALRVAAFLAWQIKPYRARHTAKATATFSGIAVVVLVLGAITPSLGDLSLALLAWTYVLGFAIYTAIMLWVFQILPRPEDVGWRSLLPGASLVGLGTVLSHVVVTHYLAPKLGRSPNLYGAFGAATVVLVWLFIAARLIVAGMFLNATLWHRQRASEQLAISSFPDDSGAPGAA
jgi:membrane protein